MWETEMVNGLNIPKITEGLLPTVANCRETAVHVWPPKPTPPQIYLLMGIRTVMGTWDKIKGIILISQPRSGEKNASTSDAWRETGMLMVQTFRGQAADVQSTQRASTAHLRLQLVLKEIRKEANPGGGPCLFFLTWVNSAVITSLPEVLGHSQYPEGG